MSRRRASKRSLTTQHSDEDEAAVVVPDASSFLGSDQTKSASQRRWTVMEPSEKEQKVKGLVRYLILGSSQRIPVKKEDLVKNVMDGIGRSLSPAITAANETLKEVFGVEAIETKKGSQVVYILVNCLPFDTKDKLMNRSNTELSQFGLLGIILSFLLMRPQGTATADNIWTFLDHLGLMEENRHTIFGPIKDILNPFLEQGYIEREKKVVGEVAVMQYRWGPRAKLEIDKRQMMMILAEIHGDEFHIWERQFGDLIAET